MRNLQSAAAALLIGLGAGLAAVPALAQPNPCPPAGPVAVGARPPPPLPVYEQPPMPAYGYQWTPGYWGWNTAVNDYYWIPGVWVLPPRIGFLWTPGYWGWNDGVYIFNLGYWGPHIGFYGGIDYGFGYGGFGYDGGYWRGNSFYYNRSFNNIGGLHINALYNRPGGGRGFNRASFNGPGGVTTRATPAELAAGREGHLGATAGQSAAAQRAALDRGSRAGVNNGHPLLAAAAGAAVGAGAVHAAHVLSARHAASADHGATGHGLAAGRGAAAGGRGGAFRESTHRATESTRHEPARGGTTRERPAFGGGGGHPGFAPRTERPAEGFRGGGGGHPGGGAGGGRPAGGGGGGRPPAGHPAGRPPR